MGRSVLQQGDVVGDFPESKRKINHHGDDGYLENNVGDARFFVHGCVSFSIVFFTATREQSICSRCERIAAFIDKYNKNYFTIRSLADAGKRHPWESCRGFLSGKPKVAETTRLQAVIIRQLPPSLHDFSRIRSTQLKDE